VDHGIILDEVSWWEREEQEDRSAHIDAKTVPLVDGRPQCCGMDPKRGGGWFEILREIVCRSVRAPVSVLA